MHACLPTQKGTEPLIVRLDQFVPRLLSRTSIHSNLLFQSEPLSSIRRSKQTPRDVSIPLIRKNTFCSDSSIFKLLPESPPLATSSPLNSNLLGQFCNNGAVCSAEEHEERVTTIPDMVRVARAQP